MKRIKMEILYEVSDDIYEDMKNESSPTQRSSWKDIVAEIGEDLIYASTSGDYEDTLNNTAILDYKVYDVVSPPLIFEL